MELKLKRLGLMVFLAIRVLSLMRGYTCGDGNPDLKRAGHDSMLIIMCG